MLCHKMIKSEIWLVPLLKPKLSLGYFYCLLVLTAFIPKTSIKYFSMIYKRSNCCLLELINLNEGQVIDRKMQALQIPAVCDDFLLGRMMT